MFPTDHDFGHLAPSLTDSWGLQSTPRSHLGDGWAQGRLVRTACSPLSLESITVAAGTRETGGFGSLPMVG